MDAIATDSISSKRPNSRQEPLVAAYVALLLFMFIYCARPEDWIPGLSNVPLAKIAGILALLALAFSLRHIRQRLPREVIYLALLVVQLFFASILSPVWRGGAVQVTLDFAKVLIVVIVLGLAVNTLRRLRFVIFVQAASVAIIAAVALWRGRLNSGRLAGVLNGNYSNPNDLAFVIAISLPLCLALLFLSRNVVLKAAWALAMLVMTYVIFLTGSRGGFISLVVVTAICLWEFAVRGRRRYLLVFIALVGVILWQSSSDMLTARFKGIFDPKEDTASAYGSAQERQQLFWRSVDVTKEHPLFGVGPGNFAQVSGSWRVTHNSYTQLSSEAGVPAFALYGLILWCGFKNLRAIKLFGRGQKERNPLAGALLASLVGYLVGSSFGSVAYQFFPYLLVAYTTSLYWIAKKSGSHSKRHQIVCGLEAEKASTAETKKTELSWHSA